MFNRNRRWLIWAGIGIIVIAASVVTYPLLSNSNTPVQLTQGSSGDAVFVKISQTGISVDASEIVIRNFYPGARAEVTYRIHNATGAAIKPEIYWSKDANVADYSKADGAVRAPDYVADWLQVPKLEDIPPGQIVDYTVAIEMPKEAKKITDSLGFRVDVAGNTGGKLQMAVGTWWLVTMR